LTGKEKLFAALSREGTAEIPVTMPYEGIYIRDCWDKLTDLPWWYAMSPRREHILAFVRDIHEKLDQDWINPPFISVGDMENAILSEEKGRVYRRNLRDGSVVEVFRPPVGGEHISQDTDGHSEGNLPYTVEEFESYKLSSAIGKDQTQLPDVGLLRAGSALFPGRCAYGLVESPLECCFSLWGFERTMILFHDDPELLSRAARWFLDMQRNWIRSLGDYGIGLVWVEECYSDMISPDLYRTMSLPLLREMLSEIRSAGMLSVHYFTGNFNDRLHLLTETGADALALEEGKKGFSADVIEIAEAVKGKCALVSNLDTVNLLQIGTESELRDELKRHRESARVMGGRFVYGLGSSVTPGTPLERLQTYFEMAREYGRI